MIPVIHIPLAANEPLLRGHLEQPLELINVTDPLAAKWAGYYLFGFEQFLVKDVRVAGVMQRSFTGHHEDFILGVLSVFLIALLSEITQTVLLRTRRNRVAREGLYTALALDEAHHFRNIWGLLKERGKSKGNAVRKKRRLACNSVLILVLALSLLAAEVLVVYLTQPVKVFNAHLQYNIRGVQPASTALDMAIRVDELTRRKRCVTPSMVNSSQDREYIIKACIMRSYNMELQRKTDLATSVTIGSWYHEAGSDHTITFTDGVREGSHELTVRATIMKIGSGETLSIRFQVKDEVDRALTKYLQKYMMYTALRWSCNQTLEERTCPGMADDMISDEPQLISRTVELWDVNVGGDPLNRTEPVTQDVTGVVSKFRVNIRQPFVAIEQALHVFATSAVIEEVEGRKGMYVDSAGDKQDHIPELLSEEGRIAGIFALLVLFFALFALLIVLRISLRPVSLAQIARSRLDNDGDMDGLFLGAVDFNGQSEDGSNFYEDHSNYSKHIMPKKPSRIFDSGRLWKKNMDVVTPSIGDGSSVYEEDSFTEFDEDTSAG